MLSDAEKTDTRRFTGYPVYGTNPSGNMGWQYFQVAGMLEYRMNNLTAAEETVLRQYLATLNGLEMSVTGASTSLDTQAAGEWTRNPAELSERTRLLDDWRRRLCAFMGVPAGPGFGGGGSVTLVV